ncbi:hypothetical protein M2103_000031 [Ereboglobus sp. PH5-5]|uniref:hypothetical protein n=1 Tax=Ereboglobus sp. PH5-5 TaxID=2940529 RepID=UPI002406BA6F|nr:hypothetical protein [Ereboglobus sp. PH5-5]MDF9831827.1 hypothetical protein [Ereboglobus sp. PH5-5]
MRKLFALMFLLPLLVTSCGRDAKIVCLEMRLGDNRVFISQPLAEAFIIDDNVLFPFTKGDSKKVAAIAHTYRGSVVTVLVDGLKTVDLAIPIDFSESEIELISIRPDNLKLLESRLSQRKISIHKKTTNNANSKGPNRNFLLYRDNPEKQNELNKMLDAVQEELNR